MNKTIRKTTLLISALGTLTSCSIFLSARSVAKGLTVLDSFLENVSNVEDGFTPNGTRISIALNEGYEGEKKKQFVSTSSFSLDARYSKTANGETTSFKGSWGDETKTWVLITEDGKTTYKDQEGERNVTASDDFYLMNEMDFYLADYFNYPLGFMFKEYISCVYKQDDVIRTSLLTGCNIDSTAQSSWTFSIFSDYRNQEEDDKRTLGFTEGDYKKFFYNTRIEAKPAYAMKIKIDSGKITSFKAEYEYKDEELDKVIEGKLEMNVTYGG